MVDPDFEWLFHCDAIRHAPPFAVAKAVDFLAGVTGLALQAFTLRLASLAPASGAAVLRPLRRERKPIAAHRADTPLHCSAAGLRQPFDDEDGFAPWQFE